MLGAGLPKWTFGGAYLFWSQLAPGEGEILYCGEAVDLIQRQSQHLRGPRRAGNQHGPLTDHFAQRADASCGLALLVIPPDTLPWWEPPDDPPFLEDDVPKRAGEQLEALLLRASIDLTGDRPRFNSREDESHSHHDHDLFRYLSLARYLLDFDDVTMDFRTYFIRAEVVEATKAYSDDVARCAHLR